MAFETDKLWTQRLLVSSLYSFNGFKCTAKIVKVLILYDGKIKVANVFLFFNIFFYIVKPYTDRHSI